MIMSARVTVGWVTEEELAAQNVEENAEEGAEAEAEAETEGEVSDGEGA